MTLLERVRYIYVYIVANDTYAMADKGHVRHFNALNCKMQLMTLSHIATSVSHFFTAQKVAHTNMLYTSGHKQQAITAGINITHTHPGSADSSNLHTQSHSGLAIMYVTVCGYVLIYRPTPEAVSHPNKFTPAALT